jgi:hypothetical protein
LLLITFVVCEVCLLTRIHTHNTHAHYAHTSLFVVKSAKDFTPLHVLSQHDLIAVLLRAFQKSPSSLMVL